MSADANFYPVRVTWDEACSGFAPGARWISGAEYYAVECWAWVPAYIEELMDEEAYLAVLWEDEYYGDSDVYGGGSVSV